MIDNHRTDPDAFHGGHTPNASRPHVEAPPLARGDRFDPEETTDDHPDRAPLTTPIPNGPHRSWSAHFCRSSRGDPMNEPTDQRTDHQ